MRDLEEEGEEDPSRGRVSVREGVEVPSVMGHGARDKVRGRKEREEEPRRRPSSQTPTKPLHYLTQIVWACHQLKETTPRDLITCCRACRPDLTIIIGT